MNNIAIFGAFFGDEAKARIVHGISKDYDYICRFGGSLNAGHTIYHNNKKIVRHMIPSADFENVRNKAFLGSGMVLDMAELLKEVQETENMFPGAASRIIVDPDAFVILPEHIKEDREKNAHIGSTGKGVSPAYRDKINRCGIRVSKLLKDNNEITNQLSKLGVQFKYVLELKNEFEKSNIIFEGSQSILLDINHGTYPYVTSGECGLGGIINSGFAFAMPSKIYGVLKAYSTRVGTGPFPTELLNEEGNKLREKGQEYGATTGRPRRVGWLDLPALNYAINKSGITDLIITKLDILNGMSEVPVAVSYNKQPNSSDDFFNPVVNYENFKGWSNAADPSQISPFISNVEKHTQRKVTYISCGVNPQDLKKWA